MFDIDQVILFNNKKYVIIDKWKDGTGYRYEIKKAHAGKPKQTKVSWSVSETVLKESN